MPKQRIYEVFRSYFNHGTRTLKRDLTLEEAQKHCQDPETSSRTCTGKSGRDRTKKYGPWFDGYRMMAKYAKRWPKE